jgi:hypothetical protein
MPALEARADANRGTLLLQSGQTLLAHGAGRAIGGLHMQLAALRGASDGDGRPGGRRRRLYALCCVEMQLPIHRLLGMTMRRVTTVTAGARRSSRSAPMTGGAVMRQSAAHNGALGIRHGVAAWQSSVSTR